jgi:hypothetical protein
MKLSIEFDTAIDNIESLQKLVDGLNSKVTQEKELENLLTPLTNNQAPTTKVVGIKTSKVEYMGEGTHVLADGTRIIIHPIKDSYDSQALRSRNGKPYYFKSPDGVVHILPNNSRFCKTEGLTSAAMAGVALGTTPSYKGWSSVESKYKYIDPYSHIVNRKTA